MSFPAARVRVMFLPFVFVLGIGAIGIVVGRRHHSLHDVVAGTGVLYDWGERQTEAPAQLARWLTRHGVDVELPAPRPAT